jgi:hypothetical protein
VAVVKEGERGKEKVIVNIAISHVMHCASKIDIRLVISSFAQNSLEKKRDFLLRNEN